MITKEELNEGLQSDNEAVRAAALKLNMLIHSGRYTKDQALQMEQTFLEVSTIDKIKDRLRFRPVPLKMEIQHPSLQEILLALESTSPMYRKKAINVYRISQNISDEQDPFYQEAVSRFYSSQRDYLEALRLIELGVLDISSTNLDQAKGSGPKIIGTMTIADDLFQALDSDDPHLKACANVYYEVLIAGASLRDPRLNRVCRDFKNTLEDHNAKLRAQLEELQILKGQGQTLIQQLHDCEDMQASLSSKIKDLTLIPDQGPSQEADVGQPEIKPQGNLREQPEATPDQLPSPFSVSQGLLQMRKYQH